jgi:hypothetical protein
MRKLLPLLLLVSFNLKAQEKFKFNLKQDLPVLASLFAGGMADGLNQAIEFRYSDFKHVFPNANDQFWNPQISWTNKYKNHNPADGPAFIGSTGPFVALTDGYHLTRFLNNNFVIGAIVYKIGTGKKEKWYYTLIRSFEYSLVNRLGFILVYNGLQIK